MDVDLSRARVLAVLSRGWRDVGLCRDKDPNLFYPRGKGRAAVQQAEVAKAFCLVCPSREPCLAFADARLDDDVVPARHERAIQRFAEALGDADPVGYSGVLQEYGKLVAAETGDRVGGADRVPDSFGHRGQEPVAGGVAPGCR